MWEIIRLQSELCSREGFHSSTRHKMVMTLGCDPMMTGS
jgi:hypothetical protein